MRKKINSYLSALLDSLMAVEAAVNFSPSTLISFLISATLSEMRLSFCLIHSAFMMLSEKSMLLIHKIILGHVRII